MNGVIAMNPNRIAVEIIQILQVFIYGHTPVRITDNTTVVTLMSPNPIMDLILCIMLTIMVEMAIIIFAMKSIHGFACVIGIHFVGMKISEKRRY